MEEKTKVCSICGLEKEEKFFSKAYKSRCKECVSKIAKEKRDEEKKKLRDADMLADKINMATAIAVALIKTETLYSNNENLALNAGEMTNTIYKIINNE